MKNYYQITEYCKRFIADHVLPGNVCIDATMGNGNDTLTLARLVGEAGKVYAFDIQDAALMRTRKLLNSELPYKNYELILDSHTNMAQYIAPNSVDCIMFNLGYLPSGDHKIATHAKTTCVAVNSALTLMKAGGVMSICIYSGGDTGTEERDAVISLLKSLDPRRYLVLITEYANRPNNPPIPAFVIKL